jgi:hypothetical protein
MHLSGSSSGWAWAALRRKQLESKHCANQAMGLKVKPSRRKHSPRKRRNGTAPVGHLGWIALRREQCSMYSHRLGGYISSLSGQWLSKHIPAAAVMHATGETGCCLRSLGRSVKKKRTGATSQLSSAREAEKRWCYSWQLSWVLHGRLCQEDLSAWSWRISTVRSRHQGTAGEDTADWKRLSRCCGDLWIVEISSGAVITCSSAWCV